MNESVVLAWEQQADYGNNLIFKKKIGRANKTFFFFFTTIFNILEHSLYFSSINFF